MDSEQKLNPHSLSDLDFLSRKSLQILGQAFHPELDPLEQFHRQDLQVDVADAQEEDVAHLFVEL